MLHLGYEVFPFLYARLFFLEVIKCFILKVCLIFYISIPIFPDVLDDSSNA